MKHSVKSVAVVAVVAAVAVALPLGACSSDDGGATDETTGTEPTAQVGALPTAAELNDVLNRAVDPAVPADQKADTVEGGDQAPELFDIMTQSKADSGATLEVVDPVLPGILPETVTVTVSFIIPDRDPMPVSGVEFVRGGDTWQLKREWACTLIENVAPDQVPPVFSADVARELPGDVPEGEAPAGEAPEGEAPAGDVPEGEVPAA